MITILPKDLVNKIAAGEVVERPASVVKELVENALDAGAEHIRITLKTGGLEKIRIEDNGGGIAHDDLDKLFHAHATSKIQSFDDLGHIATFGFRGEALASIASVSEISLTTKTASSDEGVNVRVVSGKTEKHIAPAKTGTVIEVSNLFHNLPARRKFMRSERTEFSYCLKIIQEIALANPSVTFELFHNDKLYEKYVAGDEEARINQVVKKDLTPYSVMLDSSDITITGKISPPGTLDKSAEQYIFVNRRPVTSNIIAKAIKEAYRSFLKTDSKMSYVLFISIQPELVDVNVHPRKIEVRFLDQNKVYTQVYQSILHVFERKGVTYTPSPSNTIPSLLPFSDKPISSGYTPKSSYTPSPSYPGYRQPERESIDTALSFSASLLSHEDRASVERRHYLQIDNKFIVYGSEEGLVIIDQHAASERINYEKFQKVFKEKSMSWTIPLVPLSVELSGPLYEYALAHTEEVSQFGLDIEDLGNGMLAIQRFSQIIPSSKVKEVLIELLEELQHGGLNQLALEEKIIASLACRSAIMFNQKLSQEEMTHLIEELEECHTPYTCAHGRPVTFVLPYGDILKKLARC